MSSPQEPYQPGSPEAGLTPPPTPPAPPSSAATSYGPPPGEQGSYAPPPYGQQAPPPPFGLPGQQPGPKGRKSLYIILGIVAAGILLVGVGVFVLISIAGSATGQAKDLADDFTKLVIAGESDRAYDYLDPALQEQISHEDFVSGIATLNMDDTCTPAYNNVSAATENGVKSADVAGLITCGETRIDLAYRFEGTDDLKMINIKLKPSE